MNVLSLKAHNWEHTMNTSEYDLITGFFEPALSNSIRYDRGVGYFSSGWIRESAKGMTKFAANDGQARWITSPILGVSDWSALIAGAENIVSPELNRLLSDNIEALEGELEEHTLEALAWMIADGILEFKIACPRNELTGEFHSKYGVFRDQNSDRLGFTGSYNDSIQGLTNDETISIYKSWEPALTQYVEEYEKRFEKLWGNRDENVKVYDLPTAAKKKILKLRKSDRPYPEPKSLKARADNVRKRNNVNRFIFPDELNIREYQKEAIKKWLNESEKSPSGRGILAMATGTGKTVTSLYAASLLAEKLKPLALIIVCPYLNLATQWVEELEGLGMSCVECFGSRDKWFDRLQSEYANLLLGSKEVLPIVVSNSTFITPHFQDSIKTKKVPHMIIADEVHNLGAERLKTALKEEIKYRMGLSATPERHQDEEGTDAIFDYFGEPVFEYTIKEAIRDGYLTRYYYYPVLVDLTQQEAENYWEITQKISRCAFPDEDGNMSDAFKILLIARARLIATAQNKPTRLIEIIESLEDPFARALIYCGDGSTENEATEELQRNIDHVTSLLYGLNYKVAKFTCDESKEQRDSIISQLKADHIDAIVAIRCMDEGIDIPSACLGFILASSRNPRQIIQRRGRLLRKSEGKDFAFIYDFVIIPPDLSGFANDAQVFNTERKLFKAELSRIIEFSEDAENGAVALGELRELRVKYNLLANA